MIRAFVALPLPPEIRPALAVAQFLLPLPRRTDPETFHLTLAFLGDLPEPVLEDVHHELATLRAPALALRLGPPGLFGGARPHTAWIGVAPYPALTRLHRKVARAATTAGAPPAARRFLPHITLGRFPPPAPEDALRLERAVALGMPLPPDPVRLDRFCLYRAHRTRDGARAEAIADYPLA
jgi:2'-5' RNA ligase